MILFFEPICLPKIWGGSTLNQVYHIEEKHIGECWGISAHETYSTKVKNEKHQGVTLRELYETHPHYFGHYNKNKFPILVKLIDAKEDLSVQVHPGDAYALKHENDFGKEECWYILKAEGDKILIGHNYKNKEMMQSAIEQQKILEGMRYYPIKKHDYFYIPVGTVHAILNNTFLLEVSQSSDVTYRLYDYDRIDNLGNKRELHIKQSLEVTNYPDQTLIQTHQKKYFDFEIIKQDGLNTYDSDLYGDYLAVVEGSARIDQQTFAFGDFIMVSSNTPYQIEGKITFARMRLLEHSSMNIKHT